MDTVVQVHFQQNLSFSSDLSLKTGYRRINSLLAPLRFQEIFY